MTNRISQNASSAASRFGGGAPGEDGTDSEAIGLSHDDDAIIDEEVDADDDDVSDSIPGESVEELLEMMDQAAAATGTRVR